jgi:hypothetical protein
MSRLLCTVLAASAFLRPGQLQANSADAEQDAEAVYATKGGIEIEGWLSASVGKYESGTQILVSLRPSLGYFIIDGLRLGASVDALLMYYKIDGQDDGHFAVFGGTADVRYVLSAASRWYPFLGVFGGLGKVVDTLGGIRTAYGMDLGIKLMLGDTAVLGFMLKYDRVTYSENSGIDSSTSDSITFSTSIGLWLPGGPRESDAE